ncbi:hypothetical protein S245_070052, partial [Arachis hypogaea]
FSIYGSVQCKHSMFVELKSSSASSFTDFYSQLKLLLTMIFMQEFRPHKVLIYLGIISLSLLGKSFGVPVEAVERMD